MIQGDPTTKSGPELPGPSDFNDPAFGRELRKALVWAGVAVAIILVYVLSQPLLLIVGGLVFAQMLDGGVRLLGKVLPIKRSLRLAIVAVSVAILILGFFVLAGTQLAGQAAALQATVMNQVHRLLTLLHDRGLIPEGAGVGSFGQQIMGSFGKVTAAVGSALGALSSLVMIVVIGLFVAMEPRLYERGIAWMLPLEKRDEFYATSGRMGHTLRRVLLGRVIGMID